MGRWASHFFALVHYWSFVIEYLDPNHQWALLYCWCLENTCPLPVVFTLFCGWGTVTEAVNESREKNMLLVILWKSPRSKINQAENTPSSHFYLPCSNSPNKANHKDFPFNLNVNLPGGLSCLPLAPKHNVGIMRQGRVTKEIWWFSSQSQVLLLLNSGIHRNIFVTYVSQLGEFHSKYALIFHSFIQQLISTLYVPGTILHTGDRSPQNPKSL